MTETEVWAYLEKIAESGSILGLENMQRLMDELGNVQNDLKFIHVAGTNGKGSVCAMVSSVLMQAGICVGKYTSPAVFDRMEQYQINGESISTSEFVSVISKVREACERILAKGGVQPTVFEVETAAAFLYFYIKKCDIVVLETGMGGETDATNIIGCPLVSVLTSISMDHMNFLGANLGQIARAKAGIIKEGGLVVAVWPEQAEVRNILEEICREKHAVLTYSEVERASDIRYCQSKDEMRQSFCYPVGESGETGIDDVLAKDEKITLSMMGDYQIENAVCAIETVKALRKAGYEISNSDVLNGLLSARWEGRFSVLCKDPVFVMDGAHNADAAKKLAETVKRGFTNHEIIYIIGVLADKEHEEMLKIMLPLACRIYTVTPNHPRAMDGQLLAAEAGKYHGQVFYCKTVASAVKQALSYAGDMSVILAFGSLSYLRELREIFKEKYRDGRQR